MGSGPNGRRRSFVDRRTVQAAYVTSAEPSYSPPSAVAALNPEWYTMAVGAIACRYMPSL